MINKIKEQQAADFLRSMERYFWGCDRDEHFFNAGDERFRSECLGETKKVKVF